MSDQDRTLLGVEQGEDPKVRVAELASQGFTDKAIANNLGLTISAVNYAFRCLFSQYGVNTRAKLISELQVERRNALKNSIHATRTKIDSANAASSAARSRAKLLELVVGLDDRGVMVLDASGRITTANTSFLETLEIFDDPVQFVGRSFSHDIVPQIHSESIRRCVTDLDLRRKIGQQPVRVGYISRHGRQVVSLSVAPLMKGHEFLGSVWRSQTERHPFISPRFPISRILGVGEPGRNLKLARQWISLVASEHDIPALWAWVQSPSGRFRLIGASRDTSRGICSPDSIPIPALHQWWLDAVSTNPWIECQDTDATENGYPVDELALLTGVKSFLGYRMGATSHVCGGLLAASDAPRVWSAQDREALVTLCAITSFVVDSRRHLGGGIAHASGDLLKAHF